ncbi:natural product biosynthesis luciferase-like monooxygenase protein/amino acid adenylation domain-containing protein [Actinokineospora baliensis]|uniref:non-ribosomal peptide synthetase/type I polyketide synthase n=1 Tax=Actinokineospora baliensis TaxID=547056 RepID=UPI0019575809|nr:non-ribosomal peptide synthetase/type I polyketide synthase [Actinokineospora baliensis]MBM7775039.1 natural product biosynthesis luciferase-like monooxygenase protein/amino acid adenylation domain-containing protein [Actinokineospora baliensis]
MGDQPERAGDAEPTTVAGALLRAARTWPHAGVVTVRPDGSSALTTYPELLRRAQVLLGGLRARGVGQGDHVVLCGLPLQDFFPALWACVLGGIVPAAIAEPPESGALDRLRHTWRLLGEPLVVAAGPIPAMAGARVSTVEQLSTGEPDELVAAADGDVLLMLSSGSTGAPKAARLTGRGLLKFATSSQRILDFRPDEVCLNWLPVDHSGALLIYHWLPVFAGLTNVHAPTGYVVDEPGRWLDLLESHQVNHTWSPTFGFRLAADAPRGSRDFSAVRTVLCGGEQVTVPVVESFLDATGIEPAAVRPSWGMAETVTAITFGRWTDPGSVHHIAKSSLGGDLVPATTAEDSVTFVAVGPPAPETELLVVDHDGTPVVDRIGRLRIRSPRITPGYHGDPAPVVDADGWFDTGDMAFLAHGQLVITGRTQDVIVLNGANHFAHVIEEAVLAVPGAGAVAVCGIPDAATGTETLAVFHTGGAGVEGAIRKALYSGLHLTAGHIVPMAAEDFPRTPSGKVRRGELRDRLIAALDTPLDVAAVVARAVAEVVGHPVPDEKPFYEAGLTSVAVVRLRTRLERELGRTIPHTVFFEYPSTAALVEHLTAGESTVVPPQATAPAEDNRIAVVGMALRFPGAATPEEFWQVLRSGTSAIRRFTDAEAAAAGVAPQRIADPTRVPAIGAIDDLDAFDAEFFGMTPQEARLTDPAQRLFLQCCYHALEDGGYATTEPGTAVGVYAGSGMNLYGHQSGPAAVHPDDAMQATLGSQPDFLATRVAYRLGLTGPAIAVQTACSTSLVAIHLASQALLAGETDLALAGAAAVFPHQEAGYLHQRGSILSATGNCLPFDAKADGTVGGNGVAAVLLKRLDRALADGDTVHAVILGSAINNDGAGKVGFAAPSVTGQVDVIRRALRKAGVPGSSLSYVEAHGTGTELGDPVEFTALSRALGADGASGCALGSVKGNVGHLDSCAGMAGLIKTVLVLRHREVVPTAGLTTPNPALPLDGSPFELATSVRPLTADGPLRAGVSALGVGGTNAHVILEEAPVGLSRPSGDRSVVVPVSGRDQRGLDEALQRLRAHLAANPDLRADDVAATMAIGRGHHSHRAVLIGSTAAELAASREPADATPGTELVFAFSGQGSARRGMARDLYHAFRVFRDVLDECEQVEPGVVAPMLTGNGTEVWPTELAQPALFVFEVALARLWESLGVHPDIVAGHSLGEYAALCVAGGIDLADGVRLTAARGREFARLPEGGMLAVRMDLEAAQRLAEAAGVEVAAINAPDSVVLAGSVAGLERAEQLLSGVRHRRLAVDRAFHTSALDPALEALRELAAPTPTHPIRTPLLSGLDGRSRPRSWRPDADYLVRQAREAVRFDLVVSDQPGRDWLEVGPGGVLAATAAHGRWLPTQRHGVDPITALCEAVGALYLRGVDIDWRPITDGQRVPLPGYPFARTVFPVGAPVPVDTVILVDTVQEVPLPVVQQGAPAALSGVRDLVAKALGVEPDAVSPDRSFLEMGADSLSLMGLTRELERVFDLRVPVRDLFADVDTPGKLAALVTPKQVPVAAVVPPVAAPVSTVEVPEGLREVVSHQLRVSERLVDLMERQFALLSGAPQPVAAPQPLTPPQLTAPVRAAVPVQEPTTAAVRPAPQPVLPSTARCDFSLYFFGDYPENQSADKYRLINAATEFGDEHGFHAVWLPERHFHSFGALFPNPSVLAASLAARTTSIRLHAGSVVLPLHNPIRVAEEWSVVDNISGGRVGLCVASGWHAGDFALAPENFGRHRELVYDQLETVRQLWTGAAVKATSGSGDAIEVRLHPRPIQPMPPLYVAVVGNPESYRRAAREGLGVVTNLMAQSLDQLAENIALYRRTRAEHGLDPAAGRVVVLVHTYLGADADQARAEAYQPFNDYLRSSLSLFDQVTNSLGLDIDLDNTPADDVEFMLEQAYRRYCESRALIGSPATAAGVVDRLVAAGADEIAAFVDFGVPADRVLDSLPLLNGLRQRYQERDLPLSPAQLRIWLLERLHPGQTTYHEPKGILLEGPLDVAAFTGALRWAVNRQPELRVVFEERDGQPRRVPLASVDLDCPVVDRIGGDPHAVIQELLAGATEQTFDLTEAPLVTARLARLGDDRHLLFMLAHHIVFDSSSTAVLVQDIAAAYRSWPHPPALPPLRIREPEVVDQEAVERDLEFWRGELADLPQAPLLGDRPRPATRTGEGASLTWEFGGDVRTGLGEVGARHRATPFMAVLGAVAVVLGRFGGQTDVVVGTPVANRPLGAENEVGLFLDTVVLRTDLSGDPSFGSLLQQVRTRTADAYDHRAAQFDELVAAINPDRDPGANPLFQVMVEFENEAGVQFAPPELTARLLDVPSDRAPFDLTLYFTQHRDGLRCMVEYDTALFDESTVARLLGYLEQVLRAAIRDSDAAVSALTSMVPSDQALVERWQGAWAPEPDLCLHQLVERQVARTPGAVALVAGDREITYRELDTRAAQVAHRVSGRFVAVLLPRGPELISAVLGVLKSGSAYLPLDPALPTARLSMLVADSGALVLVTDRTTLAAHPGLAAERVVFVEDIVDGPVGELPVVSPLDPAYCIYTSGSSGRPKGVVVPHRGPVNLIRWHLETFKPARTAQWTSLSFDVSVQEVFTTLASGAALVLVDEQDRHDLAAVVAEHAVERLFLPYTPLKYLVESGPSLPSLREVFSAGEQLVLTPALREFFGERSDRLLYNQYGPTETSIIVTSHRVDIAGPARPAIGGPIPGVRIRVVDPRGHDVPVGAVGELEVGGFAVADGYLGVDSPAFVEGAYRTGDLGRWRSDGVVEYVGRRDGQVKIRGHRVEPAEVEVVLAGLSGVRDAAVVVRRDAHGERELVAYVVPTTLSIKELESRLGESLPEYLVPRQWVRLDRLPFTVNGKLDHARLPAPSTEAVAADTPETELERSLHDAWCAELGVSAVPVTRSFFELGGHSLGAVRLVNRLARDHDVRLSMTEFFRNPTIRAVAGLLSRVDTRPMPAPMWRMWRKGQVVGNPAVFTIASRVDITGHLDVPALIRAIEEVVARHQAFRLRPVAGGEVVVLDAVPVAVPVLEFDSSDDLDRWCREVADTSFDLMSAPLFRFGLGRLADRWTLMVAVHHCISDAWSHGVMWRELAALYAGESLDPAPAYLEVMAARQADADRRRNELERFWRTELADVPLRVGLPTDRPRSGTLSGRGGLSHVDIDDVMPFVRDRATAHGSTPAVVLASAVAVWIGELAARTDIVMATSSTNRLHPDLDPVIGSVGEGVLLRARLTPDFATLVTTVGDAIYRALDHQDLPLVEVSRLVDPTITIETPHPDVYFTIVTTPPAALPLAGASCTIRALAHPGMARTELYVVLVPGQDSLSVVVEYSTDLFDESTITGWLARLESTLRELPA